MSRLLKVSQAFSKAAHTYDKHALIQTFVAQRLASKIRSHENQSLGKVLEIGCGTGLLSTRLANNAELYVLTEISSHLLQKAKEKINEPHVFPLVSSGDWPCFTASFDCIVSNLALHWFQDPKRALARLAACLKPGGRLYLSALGNSTFHEWRVAHHMAEVPCGILDFVSFGQLKDWLPLSGDRSVEEEWISVSVPSSKAFLQALKGMGGHIAHPGHKPLPYRSFKRVMKIYDQNPQISCQILYGYYQKPEKLREE
jgi:malonyl-CoA O-methyltransferase